MKHLISGHNFHGRYEIKLIGPANGFTLSESQKKRYSKTLCPFNDCTCGGGYGDGPDEDSAYITWNDASYGELILIPRKIDENEN